MSLPFGTKHPEQLRHVPSRARIYVGKGRVLYHDATVVYRSVLDPKKLGEIITGLTISNFTPGPGWNDELKREYQNSAEGNPFFELLSGRRPEIGMSYDLYVEPLNDAIPFEARVTIYGLGQKLLELTCLAKYDNAVNMLLHGFKIREVIGPAIANVHAISRVHFK